MMETRYLVAYRDAYEGWWYDVCGCDYTDTCEELAQCGARANAGRQYAVFRNQPRWWLKQPLYVAGLTDLELYRRTFGQDPPAAETPRLPSDAGCTCN